MAKRVVAGRWFWKEGRCCLTKSLPYKFQHRCQFILVPHSLSAVKGWVLYQKPSSVPTPVLELSSALPKPQGDDREEKVMVSSFSTSTINAPILSRRLGKAEPRCAFHICSWATKHYYGSIIWLYRELKFK